MPRPSLQEQSLPNSSLFWWRARKARAKEGSRFRALLPELADRSPKRLGKSASQRSVKPPSLTGPGGVFAIGGDVGANAGPEEVRVPDESRFLVRFEDLVELPVAGVPGAFLGERGCFLEVDQNGDFVVSGEVVDASHVLGVGGGMVFHFADADGAVFEGLGETGDGSRLGRVSGYEPGESSRMASDLLFSAILVLEVSQEDRLGHASALDVVERRDAVPTGVEMDIDDGGRPRILGQEGGGGGGEKVSAVNHGGWRITSLFGTVRSKAQVVME